MRSTAYALAARRLRTTSVRPAESQPQPRDAQAGVGGLLPAVCQRGIRALHGTCWCCQRPSDLPRQTGSSTGVSRSADTCCLARDGPVASGSIVRPPPSGCCGGRFRARSGQVTSLSGGTGVEPVTPRLTAWCSPSELTALIRIRLRQNPFAERTRPTAERGLTARAPMAKAESTAACTSSCSFTERRRWESNPPHRPCKSQSPPAACRPHLRRSPPGN